VGSRIERMDLVRFLARCCKRLLNQAVSVLSLSIYFWMYLLLFIRATFCVALVCICMCSVSWLFWSSCQYLPSDWLDRLPWGRLLMIRRLSTQTPGQWAIMTFRYNVLFYCVCRIRWPHTIYFILLWLLWRDI